MPLFILLNSFDPYCKRLLVHTTCIISWLAVWVNSYRPVRIKKSTCMALCMPFNPINVLSFTHIVDLNIVPC
ncbi:hypothetical protein HanRHA438_Chr12g0542201 [Helianthus annuus]|nr:hypothetical protein HanRHA438_Chr12g0542201 [Helianthus annuus]